MNLLILIGAPGSGKSTFARYFLRTEENWMRLCRDDLRTMNFADTLPGSNRAEFLMTEMLDASIEALLLKGCNVLLDATHCRADYLEHYINKFNHLADISFKLFEAETDELIARCDKRERETGKHIPASVVKRFVNDLQKTKHSFDFSPRPKTAGAIEIAKQDKNLPHAILCDLDGTLALIGARDPYDASLCEKDALNEPVAEVLKLFAAKSRRIFLVSGREDKYREPTERFLKKFNIFYDRLFMRKSNDFRKDSIVKREIFDAEIAGKYFVDFVLDDRDQVVEMWRKELKLPCFQVNYGRF